MPRGDCGPEFVPPTHFEPHEGFVHLQSMGYDKQSLSVSLPVARGQAETAEGKMFSLQTMAQSVFSKARVGLGTSI